MDLFCFISRLQSYIRPFVCIAIVLLSFCPAFADPADHGRYSDLDDNYSPSTFSIIIPIILLLALGGFFLFFWIKDIWSKNKDSIQSTLGFIAVIAIVAFVGKCVSENDHGTKNNSLHQYTPPTQISNPTSIPNQNSTPICTPPVKYRTEYYDEICEHCNGTGRITCDKCNGRGYIEKYCPECNGNGYTVITKYNIEYNDPLDFLSGVKSKTPYTEKIYCFHCSGTGRLKSGCPQCGADYTSMPGIFATTIECYFCNGSGTVRRSRQVPYYDY